MPAEPLASPPPQPADERAATRTASIPSVTAPPPNSWESAVRVSLPPPSDALPKPPAPDPTPVQAAQPGWFDIVKSWALAVIGFISGFWA